MYLSTPEREWVELIFIVQRREPSTPALLETKESIPMAQPDALDVALAQLAQSFADLGLVVDIIRQSRHNVPQLQRPLADELRDLWALIAQVVDLL
jgi:hypothetical protein